MVTSHRPQITLACRACALVALVAFVPFARAQGQPPDTTCRPTETQAECHVRLKCKPSEDLEDCQDRLRKGTAGPRDDTAGDRQGDDRQRDDRGARGDRRDRDASDPDRGDRRQRGRDRDEGDRSRRQRDGRRRDDRSRHRGDRGAARGFQANKTFGLGLELGEPTGLNGKYFLSGSTALDFGVGWIYRHYYYGDGLHLYGDVLWHPTSLVSTAAFELPLYIGVGLRYWDFDYCDRGVCGYGGSTLGIRVPVGISFDFNNVPLDIFLQLVPVLDFVSGDYYDRYRERHHLGIDLSAGIRFWFR